MTTVILEGILGKKFGREWHGIHCTTPKKALQVISANVDGLYDFIRKNVEPYAGYAVIVDGEEYDTDRYLLDKRKEPPKEIRFVPLIKGSGGIFKGIFGRIVMTVAICVAAYFTAGAAMAAMGQAALGEAASLASVGTQFGGITSAQLASFQTAMSVSGNVAASLSAANITGAAATSIGLAAAQASTMAGVAGVLQGMAISSLLGTACAMLTPTPKAGNADFQQSSDKTNRYFDGSVNTERQGVSIPLVYGTVLVGSHPISVNLVVNEGA